MIKTTLLATAALAALVTVSQAQASVVQFTGYPSTSWADGTFSTNLSGDFNDGFYTQSAQSAYNGYGQNGEDILFKQAVTLDSLQIQGMQGSAPTSITISLYNGSTLLTNVTDTTPLTLVTETFDISNVTKLVFDFTGGTNAYGDGRMAAWYTLSNVTYGANAAVPEPASMALLGAGLVGTGLIRRRKST